MKKLISVILSIMMAVSMLAVTAVPAMAAVVSPESTTKQASIVVEVNGSTSNDVTYTKDPTDPNKITFTYDGDGALKNWDFPGLVEGVDYEIVSEDDNSITIVLLNDYTGEVRANAILEEASEATTKAGTTAKKDKGSTSPNTGVVSATGVAVAGAGVAILAALKKKNDAE